MEQGYEIYYVLTALLLGVGFLKGIPALLSFEKQRLLDDEKRTFRQNEERRREELHQAKLNAVKTGSVYETKQGKNSRTAVRSSQANRSSKNHKRRTNSKPYNSVKANSFKGLKGKLVDFGAANYKHEEDQNESFFVTLLIGGNEKTVWGTGLRDAVSEFELGQKISLERGEKEQVTVEKVTKDESGKIIKREMVPTYRQLWIGKPQ